MRSWTAWLGALVLACGAALTAVAQEPAPPDPPPTTSTETVVDLPAEDQGRPIHVVRANEVRKAFGELTAGIAAPMLAVVSAASLLACQLLVLALFPAVAARSRGVAVRRTWLPVLIGGVDLLGGIVVVAIAAQLRGPGALLSALVGVGFFGALVVGLAGRAQAIGARLLGPERQDQPLPTLALGWAVMAGVGVVPVVGQVLLLWWSVQALGTAVLVAFGALGTAAGGPPSGPAPAPAPAARGL